MLFPYFAFAQNPAIASYKVSDASINSGQAVTFSWTLSDAGGYSFAIPCMAGMVLKNTNGSVFNCNTPVSTTQATNDGIILIINNVSGGTQNIIGRLTPKNTGGADYAAGYQERSVSVQTLSRPITSFTASETDTSPGKSITLSWNSQVINGVNVQIECRNEITVSSPSYTDSSIVPCGKMIFAKDLSASGSLSLSFSNSSPSVLPYTVTLFPAVAANTSYDGTHAITLAFNVASDILPDPVVTYFTASTTAVNSGDSLKLSWGSRYAVGVNLKFSCNPSVIASSTQDQKQLFACDTYLFDPALNAAGDAALRFVNTSKQDQMILVTLVPSKQKGFYDAVRAKSFWLTIHPFLAPVSSASPQASPAPMPSISPAPLPLPSGPAPLPSGFPSPQPRTLFRQVMKRGSRGGEVSALQEFLKRDATLYPEGVVTGFFGAATERAVQRFQSKYGLVSIGTPATTGYGAVGPKTRNKLNELR